MNDTSLAVPGTVYTLWWIALIVTLVVFVPWAVYLLHRTWKAARAIQRHAADTLAAAAGIVANTAHVTALDATIGVAGEMIEGAEGVVKKLNTAATVLAARAS